MSAAEQKPGKPLAAAESRLLFDRFGDVPAVLIACSGGADSTALLWLMARWRKARKQGPRLIAVTVDHGLRPEAKREARDVAKLARDLGVEHRTLRWTGRKPATGIQEAARRARYGLLIEAARKAGARCVLTAHTLDDQAETLLFRLSRGSGVGGLAGMDVMTSMPVEDRYGAVLIRPLLLTPKSRLIATLKAAKVPYAEDPSNADPRFARPRWRALMPELAREGLTAERLGLLAQRVARLEGAMQSFVGRAAVMLAPGQWQPGRPITFEASAFFDLPEELALRLLGRAIDSAGDEGPVELGKLEALLSALAATGGARLRRTLAGAMVTLSRGTLSVERAPARRGRAPKRP